jgi:hypothetical protein
MKRNKLLLLFPIVLIPAPALVLAGCGGDDDNDNPTGAGDTTPPAAITDLAVDSITSNSVNLNWTVPADPAKTTTTTKYDIRWSDGNITSENWGSANQIGGEPGAQGEGTNQRVKLTGLTSETMYYFAMKAGDAASNWSNLSNVVSATTLEGVDDTTGTGDTLTTNEVLDEIDQTFSSLNDISTECEALLLLDPVTNQDEFMFMLGMAGSIIGDTLAVPDTTLADYYGTWDDTDEPGNFEGVQMVSPNPDDAFKILLESVDSLGSPISGDLTISALDRDINAQQRTITISASVSINQDGGQSASLDFSITMDLSVFEGGVDLDSLEAFPEVEITMYGELCDLVVDLSMTVEETGEMSLSGYYEVEGDRISYSVDTDIDAEPWCGTFEVWEGTNPAATTFYLVFTMCDLPDDCVTGSIEIDGEQEVSFWAEDCDSDSPTVYMNIDGQTYSGEEVFEELAGIFELIWGIDLDDLDDLGKNGSASLSRRDRFHPIRNNPALVLSRELFSTRN